MVALIAGMILFLGVHSVRIVADDWRTRQIALRGERAWKGIYSIASLAGFVLLVWGFGQARSEPVVLWIAPVWTRHLAALLTLPAFVLIAAGNMPGTRIKAKVGHPMVAGVKLWAFAHLLANGRLADVVLFGGFLAWAVVDFIASRRRDRVAGVRYPAGSAAGDVRAVVVGVVGWALFAFLLHGWLIGVKPFG
jgi:uncharacterized membrane protein